MQEVDFSLEWLSVFVEDCFSSQASCLLAPSSDVQTTITTSKQTSKPSQKPLQNPSLHNFVVPGKARSKRKRLSAPRTKNSHSSIWSYNLNPQNETLNSDPPLLKQAYWLADSELIIAPKKEDDCDQEIMNKKGEFDDIKKKILRKEILKNSDSENINSTNGQNTNAMLARRCSHCLAQRTPQWRAGPLGPKTLCNACGVRYKSGRLLPEYRPAKSPTFVSYLHSNSHKKVMEMRMALPPPPPPPPIPSEK